MPIVGSRDIYLQSSKTYRSVILLIQPELQPRFQALSPFPPLSLSRETLVAAGHVTMRLQQYRREGGSLRPFCQGEQ